MGVGKVIVLVVIATIGLSLAIQRSSLKDTKREQVKGENGSGKRDASTGQIDLGLGYHCTPSLPTRINNIQNHVKVAIIGAGVSGINAAATLETNNITDWRIFEYQNRVGGRTRTTKVGNYTVEVCAMWIQGSFAHNPILQLAKEINLQGFHSKWDYFAYPNIGGGNVPQSVVNDVVNKRWYDAYLYVGNKVGPAIQCGQIPDMALSDAYMMGGWRAETAFEFAVEECFTNSEWGEQLMRTSTLNSARWPAYAFYGEDQLPQGQNPGTPNFVTDPRGIQAIIHHLANKTFVCKQTGLICNSSCPSKCGIADPRINLNSQVVNINTDTNVITLANGSKIQADYIISTIPLGVLRDNFIYNKGLITPDWTPIKKSILYRYHMINYKKIVIKFTYQFWPQNFHSVIPTLDTMFALNLLTNYNMPQYLPGSNMILLTLNSYLSDMAENMSPSQYLDLVLKQLNAVFPGHAIHSNVVDYFVTMNDSIEWLRGAYSNMGPDMTPEMFTELWQPEANCHTFFSGEASCSNLNGYVVGGFWAGRNSALSVQKAMGNYTGLPYAENDCFREPSYSESTWDAVSCPVTL